MGTIKKESITIRVAPKFKQKLEKIAEHKKRTLSDYVRIELENIVGNEEINGILTNRENTKDN